MTNDPIQPTRVYNVVQASKTLGTSEATVIEQIKKGHIKAMELGKGYKILGENLLVFMGSPSLSEVSTNITYSPQQGAANPKQIEKPDALKEALKDIDR